MRSVSLFLISLLFLLSPNLFGAESLLICWSENYTHSLELEKTGSDRYKLSLIRQGEATRSWEFDDEAILNDSEDFFRLKFKTFGLLNWESIDLRHHLAEEVASLSLSKRDTSWTFKVDKTSEFLIFQRCSNKH